MTNPKVYVIVVNWNGWPDTLECLESLCRSDYAPYDVIVCDNGSTDGSAERIECWAAGHLDVGLRPTAPLRALSHPPVRKPLVYRRCSGSPSSAGGGSRRHGDDPTITIVEVGRNLGFAGANNVGIRHALARGDAAYFWLLNNDTVVRPDTLRRLVARLTNKPAAGMCGSTIHFYDQPSRIQALGGGTYNRWFGVPRHLTCSDGPPERVEARLGYVMAASLLASRALVEDVGLMAEDYFLFYEEVDWATRAHGRYALAYAPDSVVYHKGGQSTRSTGPRHNSLVEFHMNRSLMLFARRHCPWSLPTIALRHALVAANSIVTRRWWRVRMLAGLYRDALRRKRPSRSTGAPATSA